MTYEFEATSEHYGFDQTKRIVDIYARMMDVGAYLNYNYNARWRRWWATTYPTNRKGFGEIRLGPGFFRLTKLGQISVIIHELLHIKYPPTKARRKGGRRKGVHSGRWLNGALIWGERVRRVQAQDILPQWRAHPFAKEPEAPPFTEGTLLLKVVEEIKNEQTKVAQ